jgi:endonuclease YncB( thermonuclease family)
MKTFTQRDIDMACTVNMIALIGFGLIFAVASALSHPIDPVLVQEGAFTKRVYGRARAEVVRIKDGDTITFNIDGYPPIVGHEIDVRVYGIDTAELRSGGETAREYVIARLPLGTEVVLDNLRRGKYFRIVADVILPNGESLARELLERDLAYEYFGGTKKEIPHE